MKIYETIVPPYQLDYYNWDKHKAMDFLNWFSTNIPARTEYLLNFIGIPSSISSQKPISPLVLKHVWKWFLNRVCTIDPIPEAEIEKQREIFAMFGESMVAKTEFNPFTKLVLIDIAMLVSRIFLENHSNLYWNIIYKPKNHIFVNQPALEGFVDLSYKKPFYGTFPPMHMVHVQACKVFSNNETYDDLYDIYLYWDKLVPTEQ